MMHAVKNKHKYTHASIYLLMLFITLESLSKDCLSLSQVPVLLQRFHQLILNYQGVVGIWLHDKDYKIYCDETPCSLVDPAKSGRKKTFFSSVYLC